MTAGVWQVGHRTDAGPRPENQDAVLAVEVGEGGLLVAVADGMGGLGAGARASQVALERLEAAVREGRSLTEAIGEAHEAVRGLTGADPAGSTVVAAVLTPDAVQVAHVGDSRAYQFGAMGFIPLTRDHTVAADAEARGDLAAREVASSRWGRTLSRSLGGETPPEVATLDLPGLGEGGWLVLTSDGVHGALDHDGMEAILARAGTADEAAGALVDGALGAGTRDNVAAVVVHRPRRAPPKEAPPSRRSAPEQSPLLSGPQPGQGSARWDPNALVDRSHNERPRREWRGPGILVSLVVVALVLLLFLLLL